jgi:hypothetical protein
MNIKEVTEDTYCIDCLANCRECGDINRITMRCNVCGGSNLDEEENREYIEINE